MSDPSIFDFNGYKIKVPPKGKFNQDVPAIGNVWPNAQGTPIVSSYLVYDFAYPKVTPLVLVQSYTGAQEPVGAAGHVDGTFRKDSVSPVNKTMSVVREIVMSYQWRAVIVELNTAGGYAQEKSFVTGVQTSEEASKTFGRVLSAEASTNIPLFKGIDVKLTAAYNTGHSTQSKTVLTSSSTITEKITAPANQTFVQWQLFIVHTIKAPSLSANNVNPDDFNAYQKLFDTYGGTGIPAQFPQVSIENAPQLSGGGAIYSATLFPAT
ncbi:hypothetical protein [Ascidiaceihabitans sp.]|uniref:hypothetical protein n=1 Tax=Ascidiaceihabitans sp. TaxID=1872644 RepID=UPI00329A699D